MPAYEVIIGLEVHVQLATQSKLFCGCSTAFGQPPNSNVCAVCAGFPGALPVLNSKAIEYAVKAGLATDCTIHTDSIFARKNYFYPDLPMGYQISQFDMPICTAGYLDINTGTSVKRVGITRIHLENDAGKNIHAPHENASYVDVNRAGTPLIEVVSEPDMRSAEEAVAYLRALYGIVTALGICDGNMEEGSFRCDANVSIRPKGQAAFGTRAEIKNLNSFRFVQKAIEYEVTRQCNALEDGEIIVQETRLYDSAKNSTQSMRSKEEAHDYRYFPDPDLLPVSISAAQLTQWQAQLPELPAPRAQRFVREYGLSVDDAHTLTDDGALADFFEAAVQAAENCPAVEVAHIVLGPFLRQCNATGLDVRQSRMNAQAVADLVRLTQGGIISKKMANDILADIFATGALPEQYVRDKGLVQISDTGALEAAVDAVIAANPAEVAAYRGGKTKLISFFVGQIMRETKGKANPALVNDLLAQKLA